MRGIQAFAGLLGAALLGGCASFMAEPYQTPEVSLSSGWAGTAPRGEPAWPDVEWWRRFQAQELDGFIVTALAENPDFRAAVARVEQARARSRVASAGLYPTLTVPATAGVSDRLGARSQEFYDIALSASYELDIWGRSRFSSESGQQVLAATLYDQEAVRLLLTADVATNYFLVLSLRDRLRTAEQSLASVRRLLDLIEAQYRAGKVSALEVERQRTVVYAAEAVLPPLRERERAALDALAVLLGRVPEQLRVEGQSLRPIPLPAVAPGLPSELLERRPDIRRAEADLLAANADIGAARAAMFPTVSLTGAAGYQSDTLSNLFRSNTGFYTIAADVLGVIFDGGRLSGQRDIAIARKQELVENYRKTVLVAFQDVEDALAGTEHFEAEQKALFQASIHAREAYRLAEKRYFYGAADFTTVLDAQRAYLAAELSLDPARFAWAASVVGLYRALGGGWQATAGGQGNGSVPDKPALAPATDTGAKVSLGR
jgi:NodT family efflux transporter outer membrane factor (OMF) lipoprotein